MPDNVTKFPKNPPADDENEWGQLECSKCKSHAFEVYLKGPSVIVACAGCRECGGSMEVRHTYIPPKKPK